MKTIIKALATSINEKEYTLDCVMSAEVTDRHGEIVDIDSMSIENFMLNPVVLQSHEYDKLAIGKVLSITKTINTEGIKVMECKLKFAVDEYDVAKTHFELYKGGYMSAFSIGFRVGAFKTDADGGVTRLMDCELLEISAVSVPANQLALAKSKGVDISSVVKSIPDATMQKMLKELLIEVKGLLEVKKEVNLEENKKTVILTSVDIGKARAKTLVEQAIRQLRG